MLQVGQGQVAGIDDRKFLLEEVRAPSPSLSRPRSSLLD